MGTPERELAGGRQKADRTVRSAFWLFIGCNCGER